MCDTRQCAATGKNTNNEQQNYRVPESFIEGPRVLNGLKDKYLEGSSPKGGTSVLSTRRFWTFRAMLGYETGLITLVQLSEWT